MAGGEPVTVHVELIGGPFDGAAGPVDHYVIPSALYVQRDPDKRAADDLLLNTRGGGELYVLASDEADVKRFQYWALGVHVPGIEMAEGA